jgi:benzoyl-CoA-dihydrodiol lyase
MDPIRFDTHPDRYRHWKLALSKTEADGNDIATLTLNIPEDGGLRSGYKLKLNSYDLGVDIELADAIQRIRFEHPEVRALVVNSGNEKIFCSGANIYMLGTSSHPFKVNFCKFTNETRLYLESLSADTGIPTVAALNGITSGGGYELALACDWLLLQDDGNSAVSLPEIPLLGVLPGTGGLTRVVDKRKVRRDRADVFSTIAEGIRGKRAVEWDLVDELAPKSRFAEATATAVAKQSKKATLRSGDGVVLPPLEVKRTGGGSEYKWVSLKINTDARTAEIVVRAPDAATPTNADSLRKLGADVWALRAFRELDDALLELRFNHGTVGTVVLKTEGSAEHLVQSDAALLKLAGAGAGHDWFAAEIVGQMKRTLKRLDLTARSFFAIIEKGSCFAGSFLEIALAADRSYMLDIEDGPELATSPANFGPFPMANGLTRLQTRFLDKPELVEAVRELNRPVGAQQAEELGLITFAPDDIDWDDEVRIAVEERAAFSPDALTGMEASLRFAGPETMETKIFARLSAWQNWIFQRPNAVGPRGALTTYGKPERPQFDYNRT